MKKLIKELCKREGKKSQVKIGDVREIMSKLSDIMVSGESVLLDEFIAYLGTKRSKLTKRTSHIFFMVGDIKSEIKGDKKL